MFLIIHRFYSALVQTHCAHVAPCDFEWVTVSFYSAYILLPTEVVYWQHSLVVAWLVPRETAAVSVGASSAAYTIQTHDSGTSLRCHFIQSH